MTIAQTTDIPAIDAVLAELGMLRRAYLAELGHSLEAIAAGTATLPLRLSPLRTEPLIREVHSIAGTAGSLCLESVSEAAKDLETTLCALAARRSRWRRPVSRKLGDLRRAVCEAA